MAKIITNFGNERFEGTSEEFRQVLKTKMSKVSLPTETYVELYSELSAYVENKCYPNRKTHTENGERIEETEDDFIEIVDEVEEILRTFLKKEDED